MYQFNPTQKMSAAGLQSYTVRWRLITNYGKIKMLVSLKCVVANAMWRALKSAIFVETRLVFVFCHFALPCHSIFSSLYDITATTTSKKESERRHRDRADNNSAQRIIFGTLGLFAKKKNTITHSDSHLQASHFCSKKFSSCIFSINIKAPLGLQLASSSQIRCTICNRRYSSFFAVTNLKPHRIPCCPPLPEPRVK